jgi:DNA-binding transcriptional MerR regulator
MATNVLLYLTRDEVAEQFETSVRTITRWEQAGILPTPLKLGRKRLHDPNVIEQTLHKLRGKPCPSQ